MEDWTQTVRINIIGGGPAGLYAAILFKRTRSDLQVTVFEQNPPDATFGFGVVFSDQALDFLAEDDPETAALALPIMRRWSDIVVNHGGERIVIDGVGFAGVGRLELIQLLQRRATELGVDVRHNTAIRTLDDLPPSDLVIAADGLNSLVRTSAPDAFGEKIQTLGNHFVWYGVAREFDALTQSFVETPVGRMNAHHYTYEAGRATFIIEMDSETFARSGFAQMEEPTYRAKCEDYFAAYLGGQPLIPNNSHWRQFPVLTCETWHHGNQVLVGDALHTAHFSIGSGTRLALEDVIALVRALRAHNWQVEAALPAYQTARAPVLRKITQAALASAQWYEEFARHMDLEPWPFALSYIRRAGRLPPDRLRVMAPAFAGALDQRGIALEAS